jgi:hypothetical protein
MAAIARSPKCHSMNGVSQPQVRATMRTGGAAKCVKVPPIEISTNSRPSVAYFRRVLGSRPKNCRASSSAQIVMAAGSVMNEPRSGPTVRMASHHAPGVPPPRRASRPSAATAKPTIGRVDEIDMITTMKIGSV